MLRTTLLILLIASTMPGCPGNPGSRTDKQVKAKQKPKVDPRLRETLAQARLATQLAAWGRKHHEPAALLVASWIVARSPVKPLEIEVPVTKTGKGKVATPDKLSYKALREEAAKMAKESDQHRTVLGAMDEDLAERWKPRPPGTPGEGLSIHGVGRAGGGMAEGEAEGEAGPTARCHAGNLRAGQLLKYSFSFQANAPAMVSVTAADGSQLGCSVRDASLSLIEDTGLTSECLVVWTPSEAGRFEIQIQHKGDSDTAYTLCIN